MPQQTRQLSPAPPEAVRRVEAELRHGWWPSTLLMSVPVAIAVVLGYLVAVAVSRGDWLALVFPGVVVLWCAWMAWRLIGGAVRVKVREARLPDHERQQAVYVRGLAGTHRLAAAQQTDAFAVLDPIWRRAEGRVMAVRRVGTRRARGGPHAVVEVDVRTRDGRLPGTTTALLSAAPPQVPEVGQRVAVLTDPHHPRAVVDLRRPRGRTGRGTPADRAATATTGTSEAAASTREQGT